MTTLTGAPPVSIASAGPMSLAPPPVSGEVYDDVKLLIEGLNKHAGPEGYAVVIARSKKSKKDVDRIIYIRCDRGGKASLNSADFGRRIHSGTRLIECPFSTFFATYETLQTGLHPFGWKGVWQHVHLAALHLAALQTDAGLFAAFHM